MEKKKILITVKTYPIPANKYIETVCTAGITEDGDWIRIYPIKFRMLEQEKQFKKYEWIEVEVEKRSGKLDRRPESYRCNIDSLKIVGKVETGGVHWPFRRDLCLKNVYKSMKLLLVDADPKGTCTSLAVFKPKKIKEFTISSIDTKKLDSKKEAILERLSLQQDLFSNDIPAYWKMARSIPYRFGYKFLDEEDNEYDLMIEDWEIATLFLRYASSPTVALEKVRQKYFDDFAKKKDVYFFVGTRMEHHLKGYPNFFSIIGVFPPAPLLINPQLSFEL
ncbi:MAG: hypothetical protein CVV46_06075 [Spirochaetae bacterium HGW-Spirochaetae-2]|jgi:hypothetical protein|nr:MAG: hypothetical protein CVV46_06075 [Spirochaetae bacterium HGW-Spirochaetae-2]